MVAMVDLTQPAHVQKRRKVLNEHWPATPAALRSRDRSLPVRVRIVWEEHGEEFIDGSAARWDADHVYVEIIDERLATNGVWVKPSDVYRRSPA
jgi:hypothetical protein